MLKEDVVSSQLEIENAPVEKKLSMTAPLLEMNYVIVPMMRIKESIVVKKKFLILFQFQAQPPAASLQAFAEVWGSSHIS